MTRAAGRAKGLAEGEGRTTTRAFVAFVAYVLSNWLLTNKVFPLGTDVAPFCRDIATLAEALGFLVMSALASRRPQALDARAFLACPLACTATGSVLLVLGGPTSPALATLAICLLLLAAVFVMLGAGCSLARVSTTRCVPCVLAALALDYLLRFPLSAVPGLPCLVLYAALQVAAVTIAHPDVARTLRTLRAGRTPEDLTLTNPFSFLPRTHRLFLCLALFQCAYGVALSFGEVNNAPLATFAGVVPLLGVALAGMAMRRLPRLDTLYGVALLLVMSGFLFAQLSQQAGVPVTSNLLEAGSSCFMLVFWPALAALSARNRTGTLPLFAWSGCLLSAGVTAGAAMGRACFAAVSGSVLASSVAVGVVVLGLAAFALFGMRGFSFDATVSSLAESACVSERPTTVRTQEAVQRMAQESALTTRESEIFALLAQGRDGGYIQRQLGVSYNTVKTHVAHIYAKLGVHSHQELIDLVERAGA